ncbi:hypothetical protein GT021_01460 [Streptomyces sp. SID5470]|nr:hypothetical protein [Streptomyces sp. SID5470]
MVSLPGYRHVCRRRDLRRHHVCQTSTLNQESRHERRRVARRHEPRALSPVVVERAISWLHGFRRLRIR